MNTCDPTRLSPKDAKDEQTPRRSREEIRARRCRHARSSWRARYQSLASQTVSIDGWSYVSRCKKRCLEALQRAFRLHVDGAPRQRNVAMDLVQVVRVHGNDVRYATGSQIAGR